MINHNTDPIVPGKGSAIFLHISKPNFEGTEGCVAIEKENIIELAKNYFDNDQIIITEIDKNAYLSSLRLADHIVITCDSTSMISESAMTGKPIYVAKMPPVKKNERFQKFFRLFKSLNIIKDLEDSLEVWSYEKLNETDRISSYIKKKFKDYDFS